MLPILDTGATNTFITIKVVQRIKNVQLQGTEEVPVVYLADGTIIQAFGYICKSMGIYNEESEKAGQKYINIPEVRACVMPKLSADLILGIYFFAQYDIMF